MIEIVDPGLDPGLYLLWGGIIAFFIVIFIVGLFVPNSSTGGALMGISGMLGLMALVAFLVLPPMMYDYAWEDVAVAALEDEGYSQIDLQNREFTGAGPDGLFFSGKLVHLGGDNWQIVQIMEVPK